MAPLFRRGIIIKLTVYLRKHAFIPKIYPKYRPLFIKMAIKQDPRFQSNTCFMGAKCKFTDYILKMLICITPTVSQVKGQNIGLIRGLSLVQHVGYQSKIVAPVTFHYYLAKARPQDPSP